MPCGLRIGDCCCNFLTLTFCTTLTDPPPPHSLTTPQESDFQLTVTDDLQDAAKKAVSIAEIVTLAERANLEVSFTSAK